MIAAPYTRYSTDLQKETSTQDQLALLRKRADSEGWPISLIYSDEGVSGSTPVASRPAGQRLLAAAVSGEFHVLLLEGLDRLSRDMVEQERIVRRLEHSGIRIIGVSDGYDSNSASRKLHRGMRGIINEVYLDDLRAKVHRGLSGRCDRGLFAGGMSFGYTTIEAPGGRALEIVESEAETVRWIFDQFAGGQSCRAIAIELNRRGVPSPRGSTWSLSAIFGSPRKGTGILNNDLYRGLYIWNRTRWLKDPDTGIRKRVERPQSEWMRREMPDLRIVPAALWDQVKARQGVQRIQGGTQGKGGKPGTLLGGLLRCGGCGGPYIAVNAWGYGCGRHKDRGPAACQNDRLIPRGTTERKLIGLLTDDLLSPARVQELQQYVWAAIKARQDGAGAADKAARQRLAELERDIGNLTEAVAAMGLSVALRERLGLAEAERSQLLAGLAADQPSRFPGLIPRLVDRFRAFVADLPSMAKRDPVSARRELAQIMGPVKIVPEGEKVFAELGIYGGLLDVAGSGSGGRI